MTCTSADPLVATLFGLECLFHGHAIVQIALRSAVDRFIGPPNHFAERECEIALNMRPLDFLEHVSHAIDVDDAREILRDMGFERVPPLIYGKEALRAELSLAPEGYRLAPDQVREFNLRAFEVAS